VALRLLLTARMDFFLASGSSDFTMKIWSRYRLSSFMRESEEATLIGHTGTVSSVIFGLDGQTLITVRSLIFNRQI
jgi:WD40 repeat protein